MASPSSSRWPPAFRALRHRNYRLYFLGQLVSLTGTWMQNTALMWLVFALTGQSKWPALVSVAQVLPTAVLGFAGGVLADRLPKWRLIVATQTALLALAVVLAGLVLAGASSPGLFLALALAGGVVGALDLPARLAFLVNLVGRDDLPNAVALNSLLFNTARAAGPALGGLLLAGFGPAFCFLANAASYVAVVLALLCMDVPPGGRGPAPAPGAAPERAAVGPRRLGWLLGLAGVTALFGWPFLSLLPALAHDVLGADERGYGLLVSGTGCGALAGALALASFGTWGRRRLFLAGGVGLAALAFFGLAASRSLPLAAGCCGLLGGGLILFFATGQSVVQLSAGEHNRGRVMGLWSTMLCTGQPLGNLLAGPAADRWGEPAVLRVQGLGLLLAAAALVAALRPWAREGRAAPAGASELPPAGPVTP